MKEFEITHTIASLASRNTFTELLSKSCYALGQQLRPFCFFANDKQKEHKTVDFAVFQGITNTGKTLCDEIIDNRYAEYKSRGLNYNINDPEQRKLLVYDYLMSVSACYVEIPKWVTKEGTPTHTYDKYIVTKNTDIMRVWLNDTTSTDKELYAKYGIKVETNQTDIGLGEIRCVRFEDKAKGRTIAIPRKAYKVQGMICIPLFMIDAFTHGFLTRIENELVEFTYLKDNDTERSIITTLNADIIRQFYSDSSFVNSMLSQTDLVSTNYCGMKMSSKINRGYGKVPEIGSSIYDTGVRSLNLARLLSAKPIKVEDVDRTFINVDLSSVEFNFSNCLDYLVSNNPDEIVKILTALLQKVPNGVTVPEYVSELTDTVHRNILLLSTTYQRELHKFIISHPEWFPLYTGKPAQTQVSSNTSSDFEVVDFDF